MSSRSSLLPLTPRSGSGTFDALELLVLFVLTQLTFMSAAALRVVVHLAFTFLWTVVRVFGAALRVAARVVALPLQCFVSVLMHAARWYRLAPLRWPLPSSGFGSWFFILYVLAVGRAHAHRQRGAARRDAVYGMCRVMAMLLPRAAHRLCLASTTSSRRQAGRSMRIARLQRVGAGGAAVAAHKSWCVKRR